MSHSDVTAEQAGVLQTECLAMPRRLFAPPEQRYAELEALAAKPDPTAEDLRRLVDELIVSPAHLQHFCLHLAFPAWLDLLNPTGLLGWLGQLASG